MIVLEIVCRLVCSNCGDCGVVIGDCGIEADRLTLPMMYLTASFFFQGRDTEYSASYPFIPYPRVRELFWLPLCLTSFS